MGVGVYDDAFSSDLKASVARLSLGLLDIKDERGMEAFYNFAIVPWMHTVASYQHIDHFS